MLNSMHWWLVLTWDFSDDSKLDTPVKIFSSYLFNENAFYHFAKPSGSDLPRDYEFDFVF